MTTSARRLRRRVGGLLAGVLVAVTVTGAAASLGGVATAGLGAGLAPVSSCDPDGVSVSYTIISGVVHSVTVSDLAAGCVNGALRLTLADSSGTGLASGGPTTISGSSATVSVSPQPQAAAVAAVHVTVQGP